MITSDTADIESRADDAEEYAFVLREALADLCHLKAMDESGCMPNSYRGSWRQQWAKAWQVASELGHCDRDPDGESYQ